MDIVVTRPTDFTKIRTNARILLFVSLDVRSKLAVLMEPRGIIFERNAIFTKKVDYLYVYICIKIFVFYILMKFFND